MSNPSYEAVFQFVQRNDSPFVTSGDVAEEFNGVTDKTIRKRLNDLVDMGELDVKEVGASAKVWFVPNQESDSVRKSSPSSLNQ